MVSKTEKARILIRSGHIKKAMQIVKKFDRVYSIEEMRVLQIAYECLSGNERFYKQIGENTSKIKSDAVFLLNKIL